MDQGKAVGSQGQVRTSAGSAPSPIIRDRPGIRLPRRRYEGSCYLENPPSPPPKSAASAMIPTRTPPSSARPIVGRSGPRRPS